MRLIDADALIDDLEGVCLYDPAMARNAIKRVIRRQPTIELDSDTISRPQWISCSERLPQKEGDVLCCRNNKTMAIMHFNPVLTTRYPKGFSVVEGAFSWRQDNVIAWMPLPESYQGN